MPALMGGKCASWRCNRTSTSSRIRAEAALGFQARSLLQSCSLIRTQAILHRFRRRSMRSCPGTGHRHFSCFARAQEARSRPSPPLSQRLRRARSPTLSGPDRPLASLRRAQVANILGRHGLWSRKAWAKMLEMSLPLTRVAEPSQIVLRPRPAMPSKQKSAAASSPESPVRWPRRLSIAGAGDCPGDRAGHRAIATCCGPTTGAKWPRAANLHALTSRLAKQPIHRCS